MGEKRGRRGEKGSETFLFQQRFRDGDLFSKLICFTTPCPFPSEKKNTPTQLKTPRPGAATSKPSRPCSRRGPRSTSRTRRAAGEFFFFFLFFFFWRFEGRGRGFFFFFSRKTF